MQITERFERIVEIGVDAKDGRIARALLMDKLLKSIFGHRNVYNGSDDLPHDLRNNDPYENDLPRDDLSGDPLLSGHSIP